jgi:hypothetical protein
MASADRESLEHALEIETNTMQCQKLLKLLWKLASSVSEGCSDAQASLGEDDCGPEETTARQPRAESTFRIQ